MLIASDYSKMFEGHPWSHVNDDGNPAPGSVREESSRFSLLNLNSLLLPSRCSHVHTELCPVWRISCHYRSLLDVLLMYLNRHSSLFSHS